ncbi:virulence-associated E family protein [Butyricicoccus sp. Marseille-Q5471]|uniref:virulence-associated E family protein n=1 Tax=Butyricicoccus sp. Marseille-Q5471 TaxID=3039493 RepID=UPI0024BD0F86|nr:virulence-associated E family protein [Butyricicoccus sp. Marseille-Q5471]
MRELKIALGNSRQAKFWSNKTMSFVDICDRLKTPIRTTETAEEYAKLPKPKRDEIKDKGGFVGGHLRDNLRKVGNVACRSLWTPDIDSATPEFITALEKKLTFKCAVYSTHSHTPEAPRLRIVAPFTRDVSADEFVAISRYMAAELGIDMFDECSFIPNQLMYWPTCPSNGEYICEFFDGELLDPDAILAAHSNWQDCSLLPTTSRESKVSKPSQKPQEDPLAKSGIVGAFCRTYSITAAIDKFLSDVYAPSVSDGRYDYIAGESTAGVVIYDDKFAYSHHATDPACGKLLNAFDLVCIHKFGSDDEKKSFAAMTDFAVKDDDVKAQLAAERMEQASTDFSDANWQKGLELDKQGHVKDTLDNLVLILRHDDALQHIAFNCHRDGIDAKDGLPWDQLKDGWNDSDNAALKVYLSNNYGVYSPTKTKDAVLAVAAERAYHPIKEYLEALPEWDNIKRVETLFIDYFGAADTSYTRAVSRKSMVAAVARIYRPGTKFDSVPILNGPQGIGKSTFFAKLAGDWFSDSLTLTDMRDKSGPEKLQGYWILELGELAGMRKADVETVKSFISRVDDKYRASYGVNVESHPRQCIIVGSTNAESGFLRDITGNRRFWPIPVSGSSHKKAWQITKEEVAQIWAETLVLYHNGEKLYLEGEDAALAVAEQADAMETDEREGLVRGYLDTLLPENWDELDLYERRNFLSGTGIGDIGKKGTVQRKLVCNLEIWCECFGKDAAALKKADSYELGAIMQKLESWEKYTGTKQGTSVFPIYGKQRTYSRK